MKYSATSTDLGPTDFTQYLAELLEHDQKRPVSLVPRTRLLWHGKTCWRPPKDISGLDPKQKFWFLLEASSRHGKAMWASLHLRRLFRWDQKTLPVVSWRSCEGQPKNLIIRGFWYPQGVWEQIPHGYQGPTVVSCKTKVSIGRIWIVAVLGKCMSKDYYYGRRKSVIICSLRKFIVPQVTNYYTALNAKQNLFDQNTCQSTFEKILTCQRYLTEIFLVPLLQKWSLKIVIEWDDSLAKWLG